VTVPRGNPPENAAVVDGEVPFHDVDPLHIVWHGHYYKYLELARTVLFRRHGVDGWDLIELGYRFVVTHSECKHVSPLRYGDRYRVSAWFLDIEHRVNVGYEVWNTSKGKRAARGRTVLVTMDEAGEMLLETPKIIRDRIAAPCSPSEP
jgi:acyl-CoA thioester hydrolase